MLGDEPDEEANPLARPGDCKFYILSLILSGRGVGWRRTDTRVLDLHLLSIAWICLAKFLAAGIVLGYPVLSARKQTVAGDAWPASRFEAKNYYIRFSTAAF